VQVFSQRDQIAIASGIESMRVRIGGGIASQSVNRVSARAHTVRGVRARTL
jgi:hypothetical protein